MQGPSHYKKAIAVGCTKESRPLTSAQNLSVALTKNAEFSKEQDDFEAAMSPWNLAKIALRFEDPSVPITWHNEAIVRSEWYDFDER